MHNRAEVYRILQMAAQPTLKDFSKNITERRRRGAAKDAPCIPKTLASGTSTRQIRSWGKKKTLGKATSVMNNELNANSELRKQQQLGEKR